MKTEKDWKNEGRNARNAGKYIVSGIEAWEKYAVEWSKLPREIRNRGKID